MGNKKNDVPRRRPDRGRGGDRLLQFHPAATNEEAAGTIGKVEKHRPSSLATRDVILGGQGGLEADTALAQLLDDAATLRNVSAELANVSRLGSGPKSTSST